VLLSINGIVTAGVIALFIWLTAVKMHCLDSRIDKYYTLKCKHRRMHEGA